MEDYNSTLLRIRSHIKAIESEYPNAWRKLAELRALKKRDGSDPDWPNWCYVPYEYVLTMVHHFNSNYHLLDNIIDTINIAMFGAWRLSQGIFKFHPETLKSLLSTKIDDKIPIDHLFKLPEFCSYISLPEGTELFGYGIYGFFVQLECNINKTFLRVLLDTKKNGCVILPLPLISDSLANNIKCTKESVISAMNVSPDTELNRLFSESLAHSDSELSKDWAHILNMILYLCAENAEIHDAQGEKTAPRRPSPVKTKKGYRIFPEESPTFWLVGYEIGELLKKDEEKKHQPRKTADDRWSPRPHLRRAHWHSYWTGHRNEEQKLKLRWLYPMLIGTKIKENMNTG